MSETTVVAAISGIALISAARDLGHRTARAPPSIAGARITNTPGLPMAMMRTTSTADTPRASHPPIVALRSLVIDRIPMGSLADTRPACPGLVLPRLRPVHGPEDGFTFRSPDAL